MTRCSPEHASRRVACGPGLVLLAGALVVSGVMLLMLTACSREPAIEVAAEIVEAAAPVSVEIRTTPNVRGHHVLITWRGNEAVVLGGAPFLHFVSADGMNRVSASASVLGPGRAYVPHQPGALYTSGYDCGWAWEPQEGQPYAHCWAVPPSGRLEPGDAHAYLVRMSSGGPAPAELAAGTYVIDEIIEWWFAGESATSIPDTERDGAFTVRLTYEVR
jgi:hypothetical protein